MSPMVRVLRVAMGLESVSRPMSPTECLETIEIIESDQDNYMRVKIQ